MEENGLDPETLLQEAGFDILCPPPYEAVEPSDTRIACVCAHDVICKDGEIFACDHPDSKANCEAFVKIMEKFVLLFRHSNEGERNLLAGSIIAILRLRGGRFLVCDDSGDGLFEGGDANALHVVLSVLHKRVERLVESEEAGTEASDARKRKRTAVWV
jgi:hypothetical protein